MGRRERQRERRAATERTVEGAQGPASKGRPTLGRRQRQEAARRRARRRRLQVRAWWALAITALLGLIVFLALSGVGTGPG